MDSQTKTGKVYLRPHKDGKKWKPVLLSLFPPSSSGVGRLEVQDMGGGDHSPGVRRHHQPQADRKLKVVRLSELIRVLRLPPNAEACPMDNMSAFCVETQDRTMVFAALKDECVDWVDKLCHSTFQRGGGSDSNQLHMEENQIYASADDVPVFWIGIQRTDAATRCGLQGSYWLQVGREALLLRETQKKDVVRKWPYELLRRYGSDKLALTIEAGRRCDSGPGTFTFETQQAEKIFSLIQSTIKQKTSSPASGSQHPESKSAAVTNTQAHSPLPKIPVVTSMAAILESKLRTPERKCPVLEDGAHAQEGSVAQSESAPPAPITLMPLPLVPTHDSASGGRRGALSDGIYADPADCIQSILIPQSAGALYVDPASVLPLKPPQSREPAAPSAAHPGQNINVLDPVYSEVYDQISAGRNKPGVLHSKARTDDEPIYTEPTRGADKESPKTERKLDPFAHLYAQVCKTPPSSGRSPSPNTTPSTSASHSSVMTSMTATKAPDESLDDVIYENLGII